MKRELETKLELSRDAFERVLSASRLLKRCDQLNVYYDWQDTLAEYAATLRIRYQPHSPPQITLKIPVETKEGRRSSIEIEEFLNRGFPARCMLVDRDLSPSFRQPLRNLGISKLVRLGAMRNCRILAELPEGSEVELDEVELPDGSAFFELEIESDDPSVHVHALGEIAALISEYSTSDVSKFQRFRMAVEAGRRSAPFEDSAAGLSMDPDVPDRLRSSES